MAPNNYTNSSNNPPWPGSAAVGGSAAAIWQQYEQLKMNSMVMHNFVNDLINRFAILEQRMQEEQQQAPQSVQIDKDRMKYLEHQIAEHQSVLRRDPYILLLIDGDGMIFESTYLRQGEAGGMRAAVLLHDCVAKWAIDEQGHPKDVKITARIYANLDGLAEVCTRAGLVNNPLQVKEFARGLTQGKTMFDFVDVGPGKDEADAKICSSFKLHLYDYHCRQILLGCSHDSGYAKLLGESFHDDKSLERVTLLEGVPFGKELEVLPFSKKKFEGIFRQSKINLIGTNGHLDIHGGYSRQLPMPLKPIGPPSKPGNGVLHDSARLPPFHPEIKDLSLADHSQPTGNEPPDSAPAHSRSRENAKPSWVAVTKSGKKALQQDDVNSTPQPAAVDLKKIMIRRNRKGQRIDSALPRFDKDEFWHLKVQKLCNRHYLHPQGCPIEQQEPGKCNYRHDLKLSNYQVNILRAVARESPCRDGTGCDDVYCMQGHQCPFPKAMEGSMRGLGCRNMENCSFSREMHAVDTSEAKFTTIKGGRVM